MCTFEASQTPVPLIFAPFIDRPAAAIVCVDLSRSDTAAAAASSRRHKADVSFAILALSYMAQRADETPDRRENWQHVGGVSVRLTALELTSAVEHTTDESRHSELVGRLSGDPRPSFSTKTSLSLVSTNRCVRLCLVRRW